MDKTNDVIRGLLVIISHSVSLYIITTHKERVRHPAFYWFVVTVLASLIISPIFYAHGFTFRAGGLSYFLLAIIYALAFFLVASGPVMRNVFIFLFYVAFFMLAATVASLLGQIFLNGNTLGIALIRTSFSLVFCIIYPLYAKKPLMRALDEINREWWILVSFELIAFLTISLLSFLGTFFFDSNSIYLLFIILVSLLIVAAYILMMKIIILLKRESGFRQLEAQQSILENELETEKEFVESAKRFRHDLIQHDRIIRAMILDGKTEEALSYMDEYEERIDRSSLHDWCENRILNALLCIAARRMYQLGGEISIDAAVPDDIAIKRVDLTTIFGNILDNAYTSCISVEQPFFSFRAFVRNGSLYAEIRNSVDDDTRWQDGLPVSKKANGGIGLRNVRDAVNRYNGILEMKAAGGSFLTRIVIPFLNEKDL